MTKKSSSTSKKTTQTKTATKTEYFDYIKENLSSIMNYSISGTKTFNQCDLLLYPDEGGIFIVEGTREGTEWKELKIRDIQSDIIKALNRGDVQEFNTLISNVSIKALKQPIECTCKTLLHNAAEQGNIEIAKLLINLGVPVDIKVNKQSMTPLHAAIIWDQKDMEKFLIAQGASLQAPFKNHTAKGLAKLKNTLNNRKKIYNIFDEAELQELLSQASNYHFKSRILSLCRRRLGELKSAKNIRQQAKKQWSVKQGKKVKVYQEELEQAIADYEREAVLKKVKTEQECKLNRKVRLYHDTNKAFKKKHEMHEQLQKKSMKRAQEVLKNRKAKGEVIDPWDWLKQNNGMVVNKVLRN